LVNKGANIDLLFRNGLRDYEVLPPVDVWNSIVPTIRKKQRSVIFLRSAALIAVLLSVSFLAYRWSREVSVLIRNPVIALNEESFTVKDNSNDINKTVNTADNNQSRILQNDKVSDEYPVSDISDTGNMPSAVPGTVTEVKNPELNDKLMFPSTISAFKGLNYKTYNSGGGYTDPLMPANDVLKEKTNRWSVMAMASPTYYLRPESAGNEVSNQISSSEQSRISYSGGVGFAYKISKKISIQSGLYYSSIGNEVDGINSFAGFRQYDYTKGDHNFEVLTSSGRIYTENTDVFLRDNSGDRVLTLYTNDVFDPAKANLSYLDNSLFQNFSYLEMPVILRYKVIDKSIDFNLIGGFSYNLLVSNSVHAVIDGSKYNIGKTAGLNPLMISSSLGMGMEYNLSDRFSINLEPTFRYYINPFGGLSGITAHPYSFGVFSGLSYKF